MAWALTPFPGEVSYSSLSHILDVIQDGWHFHTCGIMHTHFSLVFAATMSAARLQGATVQGLYKRSVQISAALVDFKSRAISWLESQPCTIVQCKYLHTVHLDGGTWRTKVCTDLSGSTTCAETIAIGNDSIHWIEEPT